MLDVEFASVDEMLLVFLGPRMQVPVRFDVPSPRPNRWLRAWRTGGGALNRALDEPIVTVQGWAPSASDAEDITKAGFDAVLRDFTGMPLVRGVDVVTSPYFDPDPDSKTPRYSATLRLRVRARRR